ncbi:penicillin-binding protein 2 [Patescibacteria group bacterium]|nr:penicillin-binding protein 2 [Patescibacteria group bacterium]
MSAFHLFGNFKRKEIQTMPSLEPQEILLDKLAKKKAIELGVSERKFEVPLSPSVLQLTYLLFLILISALFYRTFQLQVIRGQEFFDLAERNKYIIYQIKATRGIIYDQNMEQLVSNQPAFNLLCYKSNLPEDELKKIDILEKVANILQIDFQNLEEKINNSQDNQLSVADNLSHQQLLILETEINDLIGFEIEKNYIRQYKDGNIFAHLLGYLGKIKGSELRDDPGTYSINDYVGRDGLEYYYENFLRKDPGEMRVERDALGNVISKETIQLPQSGQNLVLWTDAGLQRKIESSLSNKMQEVGSKKAVALALDPNTGGVLALVSLPSFDNNIFSNGSGKEISQLLTDKNNPLFNQAIAGIGYPTGSVIKPLIASAGLEEGIISPNKTINCQGEISIDNVYYDPDNLNSGPEKWVYRDLYVHGIVDLRKAIAESCNVYFYRLGGGYEDQKGLGPIVIEEYLRRFGWGDLTNIDLPGEGIGTLPKIDKNWTLGNTYHLSIGQGPFAVTPLQVANAFASIANGGTLYQPQVVHKIIDTDSDGSVKVLEEFSSKIISQGFIQSDNLAIIREAMRQAVTNGSATGYLDNLSVEVAAKTGTSQTGRDNYYHNWIVSFAPYENPKIVLLVLILDVEDIRAAVLPVARDILDWYFNQ